MFKPTKAIKNVSVQSTIFCPYGRIKKPEELSDEFDMTFGIFWVTASGSTHIIYETSESRKIRIVLFDSSKYINERKMVEDTLSYDCQRLYVNKHFRRCMSSNSKSQLPHLSTCPTFDFEDEITSFVSRLHNGEINIGNLNNRIDFSTENHASLAIACLSRLNKKVIWENVDFT